MKWAKGISESWMHYQQILLRKLQCVCCIIIIRLIRNFLSNYGNRTRGSHMCCEVTMCCKESRYIILVFQYILLFTYLIYFKYIKLYNYIPFVVIVLVITFMFIILYFNLIKQLNFLYQYIWHLYFIESWAKIGNIKKYN